MAHRSIATEAAASEKEQSQPAQRRRRFLHLLPAVGFAAVAVPLAWGLTRDPSELPSALLDKQVPSFDLPVVQGRSLGLASSDLTGEVSLVNVFASWCVACRAEHPLFMELAASGVVPFHGLNYKDRPEDAAAWLDRLGDPYTRIGYDPTGRAGIEWGVYGYPETFLINPQGQVVYKYVGPISPRILNEEFLPRIEALRAQ